MKTKIQNLLQEKEDQKLKKVEAKSETKIDKLENKVKEVEQERKKVLEEKKDLEKKVQKLEPKIEKVQPKVVEEKKVPKVEPVKEAKLDYEELTVTELRALAKKRNIVGVSQLKKAELIEKLKAK